MKLTQEAIFELCEKLCGVLPPVDDVEDAIYHTVVEIFKHDDCDTNGAKILRLAMKHKDDWGTYTFDKPVYQVEMFEREGEMCFRYTHSEYHFDKDMAELRTEHLKTWYHTKMKEI